MVGLGRQTQPTVPSHPAPRLRQLIRWILPGLRLACRGACPPTGATGIWPQASATSPPKAPGHAARPITVHMEYTIHIGSVQAVIEAACGYQPHARRAIRTDSQDHPAPAFGPVGVSRRGLSV